MGKVENREGINKIIETLIKYNDLDYESASNAASAIIGKVSWHVLKEFGESWSKYDKKTQNSIAVSLFGHFRLSDGLTVIKAISDSFEKSKIEYQINNENKENSIDDKKLGIKIHPRLEIPKDESGNPYLGLYIDGKEINKLYLDKTGSNTINVTVNEIKDDGKSVGEVVKLLREKMNKYPE